MASGINGHTGVMQASRLLADSTYFFSASLASGCEKI